MSQNITALVVDDEASSRENICILLQEFCPHISILGTAGTITEAELKLIELKPQLVFLDIQLGADTIFTLLKRIPKLQAEIIFISAHDHFALSAFEFMAIGYLLKPIDIPKLIKAVDHASKMISNKRNSLSLEQVIMQVENINRKQHKIALSTSRGYELVYVSEIMYCEADGSYTHFYFSDGRTMVVSKNLKYYEKMLENYGFVRSHNTILANLRFVKALDRTSGGGLILENGKMLAVTKTKRKELEDLIREQRRLV